MDVFEWIRKNKWLTLFAAIVLFFVVPFIIDKLYSLKACVPFLAMQYKSSDVLSFYGNVLGSAITIFALIETILHTEKMHALDYERKLTPLLDSNIYNHATSSITPLRILYVNLGPNDYYDKTEVSTSIDPRDLEDTFYGEQIDYLLQNISETSAVNIKVYLNETLLYGPFSLVAGSESSVGICFFDQRDRMIGTFPDTSSFDIKVVYTNENKSKTFIQTERITITHIYMSLRGDPPLMPDLDMRTGLSNPEVV